MEWIEVLWKHNKEDGLKVHPRTGTGQVEPLKVYDEVVEVLVLSAFGHYR